MRGLRRVLASRRLAAVFAAGWLLAACAGCDAGADDVSLVAEWDAQSQRYDHFLTVSEPQRAVDPTSPGIGGIVVSGAHAGTLRYVEGFTDRFADEDGGNYENRIRDWESDRSLRYGTQDGLSFLLLGVREGDAFYTYWLLTPDPVFTLTDDALEIHAARLVDGQSGRAVTLSGRLTFARMRLVPGQEQSFRAWTTRSVQRRTRVEFGADGAYKEIDERFNENTGRWADLGDGVVEVTDPYGTYRHGYTLDGSEMTLLVDDRWSCGSECNPSTLRSNEEWYRLTPGTLTQYREATTIRYHRARGPIER